MNEVLAQRLRHVGLNPLAEFSVANAGAARSDGWSARDVYAREVSSRRSFMSGLAADGLVPWPPGSGNMMDFGCGLAPGAIALSPEFDLCVAVDGSFEHCVSAVESVSLAGVTNVAVYQGSMMCCPEYGAIDFLPDTFDLILCHHGCHRKDLSRPIFDWARILRDGGRLVLVHPRFWFDQSAPAKDDATLANYMTERAADYLVSRQSLNEIAHSAALRVKHWGGVVSLPPFDMTGIVFLSSGIVKDRDDYAELIGDFGRMWLLSQDVLVAQKDGVPA